MTKAVPRGAKLSTACLVACCRSGFFTPCRAYPSQPADRHDAIQPGGPTNMRRHQLSHRQRRPVMPAFWRAVRNRESPTVLEVTIQARILHLMMDPRDEFGMAIVIVTRNIIWA
jgi:hypothetical protein